jgi:hypothetical protein
MSSMACSQEKRNRRKNRPRSTNGNQLACRPTEQEKKNRACVKNERRLETRSKNTRPEATTKPSAGILPERNFSTGSRDQDPKHTAIKRCFATKRRPTHESNTEVEQVAAGNQDWDTTGRSKKISDEKTRAEPQA